HVWVNQASAMTRMTPPTSGLRSCVRTSWPSTIRRWRWPPTTRVRPVFVSTECCLIRNSTYRESWIWPPAPARAAISSKLRAPTGVHRVGITLENQIVFSGQQRHDVRPLPGRLFRGDDPLRVESVDLTRP